MVLFVALLLFLLLIDTGVAVDAANGGAENRVCVPVVKVLHVFDVTHV